MEIQTIKFIERIAQGEIAASSSLEIDLNDLRARYGDNFNTLIMTNTDDNNIDVYLDGIKLVFITGSNGSFNFNWESGINFNFLKIENLGAADVIAADKVKISVGRTGRA